MMIILSQDSPKQNHPLAVHFERTSTTESFTPIRSCLVSTTRLSFSIYGRVLPYHHYHSYRPPQRSSRGDRRRAVLSLRLGEYGRSPLALSTKTLAYRQDWVVPLCGESVEQNATAVLVNHLLNDATRESNSSPFGCTRTRTPSYVQCCP